MNNIWRIFSLIFLIQNILASVSDLNIETGELSLKSIKENIIPGNFNDIKEDSVHLNSRIHDFNIESNNSQTILDKIASVSRYIFNCSSNYLSSKIFFLLGSGSILYKFKGIFITIGSITFMFILGLVCDFLPVVKPFYSFILPVYSTLAIFQFSTGYLDILITSILQFIKGNDTETRLSLFLVSLFIFIPFILGFLLSQEAKLKKSPYHHYFLIVASIIVAIRFNLYEHGSYILSTISKNEKSGIILKATCFIGKGILTSLNFIFSDALNLICRIATFFVSLETMNEIYNIVLNFTNSEKIIPS